MTTLSEADVEAAPLARRLESGGWCPGRFGWG